MNIPTPSHSLRLPAHPYTNNKHPAVPAASPPSPAVVTPDAAPGNPTTITVSGRRYLNLVFRSYNYTLYDTEATMRASYNEAAAFCQRQGDELVPYWETSSGASSVVEQLCAKRGYTCWVRRSASTRVGLCPLMDAKGTIQEQGCEQTVRFVCRRGR